MARKQLHQSTTELIWHFLAPFFPKWLALKEKLRTNVVTPFHSPLFIGSESPEVRQTTLQTSKMVKCKKRLSAKEKLPVCTEATISVTT